MPPLRPSPSVFTPLPSGFAKAVEWLWSGLTKRVQRGVAAAVILIGALCAASLLFALSQPFGAEPAALFKDLTPKAEDTLLVGFFSGLTIILMAACAGIALFCWAMTRRFGLCDERVRFLGWGGGLLAYVVADDALMLHERIFPGLFQTSQATVLGVMAALAMIIALSHFRVIVRHGGLLFGAAAVPAISIGLVSDAHLFPASWWYMELLEESGEIFATLSWGALLTIVAREVIADLVTARA